MKAMVLFSGGIDSTTCLGMAVEKYGPENVIALSIAYGQKHTKEIEASDKIVKYYNVEHIYLDLAKIFQYSDCSLLSHSDKEIPKESYNDQIKSTNGSPVSTYVPFRNGLFLSSAASIALYICCIQPYPYRLFSVCTDSLSFRQPAWTGSSSPVLLHLYP